MLAPKEPLASKEATPREWRGPVSCVPRDMLPPNLMLGPETLILRIAHSQDREAFACLFRQYAPKLKSFAMSLGASAALAEEVVQESFLNVWRKAGQFDALRGSGPAWLFSITRNTFISHVRKHKRFEVDAEDPAYVPATSPEQQAVIREAQGRLQAAVQTLPSEQLAVLQSTFVQGLSLSEIAQQQQLPLGTVKTRARLALEKLRSMFAVTEGRDD